MRDCIFCRIVEGLEKSYTVYEDKYTIAFAPSPNTIISKRHLLLIPKKHYESIYDIPENVLFNVIKAVKIISNKLKSKYNAQGINLLHASGAVAQQSVFHFHFHFHLTPRYLNDHLDTWPDKGYRENNFPNVYVEMKNL